MSYPWLKFYPTDWRADPALRMCSAAARGVWIDLICLMHEATPYGHLLVNGRCPTDAQVAVLTGTPPDQLTQCLRELEDAGVFSRTKDGTIYSRKLTRMAKKAATARKNGRKGGNPTLSKVGDIPPSDNPPDKGRDKPQKPEARSQSIDDDDDAGARASDPTTRERLLTAIGLDASGLTGHGGGMLGTRADMQVADRWRDDLGLSVDEQIEVIADVMARKRDGPPARFSYFNRAMQDAAGAKTAPPLTPISPIAGDPGYARPATARSPSRTRSDERLAAWLSAARRPS